MQPDFSKALELWQRAGDLGSSIAYYSIGCAYKYGRGVESDEEKARHFWERAAMSGNILSRHNLGILEENSGNMDRAFKHYVISAGLGYNKSLEEIKELYNNGYATKDDYETALRARQAYVAEVRSSQRDEAAAYSEIYKYC